MIATSFFFISGLAIILLLVRPFFISNTISKSDRHARNFYHRVVHFYSVGRERTLFLLRNQVPMHSRNSRNKLLAFLRERRKQYINNMRDSKLLKKSDGMSEFFKNMSNIEKGNGEIHEEYEDPSSNDHLVGRNSQKQKNN